MIFVREGGSVTFKIYNCKVHVTLSFMPIHRFKSLALKQVRIVDEALYNNSLTHLKQVLYCSKVNAGYVKHFVDLSLLLPFY